MCFFFLFFSFATPDLPYYGNIFFLLYKEKILPPFFSQLFFHFSAYSKAC